MHKKILYRALIAATLTTFSGLSSAATISDNMFSRYLYNTNMKVHGADAALFSDYVTNSFNTSYDDENEYVVRGWKSFKDKRKLKSWLNKIKRNKQFTNEESSDDTSDHTDNHDLEDGFGDHSYDHDDDNYSACSKLAAHGNNKYGGSSCSEPSVSAVPLPAAAWLFLTGMVGLVSVARRKQETGESLS